MTPPMVRRGSVRVSEASVTVNGHALTVPQSITLRVALLSFHAEMQEPDALGGGEATRLAAAYADRAEEILLLMLGPSGPK